MIPSIRQWFSRQPRYQSSILQSTMQMSSSSSSTSVQDKSIQLAKEVLTLASQVPNKPSPITACLSIAGGGSTAISSITSVPGSSNFLLDGSVLYDRKSIAQYLSPSSSLSARVKGPCDSSNEHAKFSFVSADTSSLLSTTALHQGMKLSSTLQQSLNVLGVGCTSTVVSIPDPSSNRKRVSRAHIVLSIPTTDCNQGGDDPPASLQSVAYNIILSGDGARDRAEEEQIIGCMILWCIKSFLQSSIMSQGSSEACVEEDLTYKEILNHDGDSLTKVYLTPIGQYNGIDRESSLSPLQKSIQEIMDGDAKATIVVPSTTSQQEGINHRMVPLPYCTIPPNPLIFPGSFNPPHIGHVALANAAKKTMVRKRLAELKEWFLEKDEHDFMEDMWNTIDYQEYRSILDAECTDALDVVKFPVLFEMSIYNADKPSMEVDEALRRIHLFGEYPSTVKDADSTSSFPSDWGVLLTSSALFIDKARLLKEYLAPSFSTLSSNDESPRQMTFVIGTDTMVRILNPKYYDDSNDNMINALREMKMEGVHFVVGGRLEQVKDDDNSMKKFVTGEEALDDLPDDVSDMFTIIQEEDFRVDISSSEIRAAAAKSQ